MRILASLAITLVASASATGIAAAIDTTPITMSVPAVSTPVVDTAECLPTAAQTMADRTVFCGTSDVSEPALVVVLPAPVAEGVPTADGVANDALQTVADAVSIPVETGLSVETGIAEAAVLERASTEVLNARYCEVKPYLCDYVAE